MRSITMPRVSLSSAVLFIVGGLLILHMSADIAPGQEPGPRRGFQPGNAYAMSDFETINTTNGNLLLNFPLGTLAPGRGGVGGGLTLRYNSKLYDSQVEALPDHSNILTSQNMLVQHDETVGWHVTSPLNYQVKIVNRNDEQGGPFECTGNGGTDNRLVDYIWKVRVIYPDGAERDFRPAGYQDALADGYFNLNPYTGELRDVVANGTACSEGSYGYAANPLTYFSTDGTYTRLTLNRGVEWTLSFPDGTRLVGSAAGGFFGGAQYLYDRNGNYLTYGSVTLPNGHNASGIVDQFGHYVVVDSGSGPDEENYYSLGFNNELLMWTVKWKDNYVLKPYETTPASNGRYRGTTSSQTYEGGFRVVDRITLPSQAGTLAYQFSYNAPDHPIELPENSNGWGEVSGITLPSGAQITYEYQHDSTYPVDFQHPARPNTRQVIENSVSRKTVTYQAEYDGTLTPVTDVWTYSIHSSGSTVVGPDGGVTTQSYNSTHSDNPDAGLVIGESYPNGETIERTWQTNLPSVTTGFMSNQYANYYVKREYHSFPDANGTLTWTSIKDFECDKNGNVTREADYDFVPYSTVHGSGTFPFGLTPTRIILNTYNNPTVGADNSTNEQANAYWNPSAPRVRSLLSANEVQGLRQQSMVPFARSEFAYDNPSTTANLIRKSSWDSTKGEYSSPLCTDASLCAVNSVSVTSQYNSFGSPTMVTDAKGNQTQLFYGPVGGFTDLYPTEIKTALGTSVQRIETRQYDISSGLLIRATDADNGVSTSTVYDVFGRPTLVTAAEGKPEEVHTFTEYSDVYRRVIVRSDLFLKDDRKLVAIEHYDQLGRIRLTRQLEDAASQSPYIENDGIKVQTRYLNSNPCAPDNFSSCLDTNSAALGSYQLVSSPYRAATRSLAGSESTMGWTLSRSDRSGRTIAVQSFAGADLPAPWASNANSTGTVTTSYNANMVTVTDQAGRMRRSVSDAFGRLIRVDEPDKDAGNLDDQYGTPVQSTSYDYDVLGNLTKVTQGGQVRTFDYDSLSRLRTAMNPESGTVSYQYDSNGNLTQKTDARLIVTNYGYDQLNRIISRGYTNDPAGTPNVTYSYDHYDPNINFGKGRLASVSSSVATYTYSEYDPMGRVKTATQTLDSKSYITHYTYDLAGHTKSIVYPSTHKVNYNYDSAGRLNDQDSTHLAFTGNLGDGSNDQRTYSTGINYASGGQMAQEKLGTTTAVFNKLFYNSRGQLAQILASTTGNDLSWDRGKIVNDYGDPCSAPCNGANNNGNLMRQTISVPNEGNTSFISWYQQYEYDKLNRLLRVHEYTGNTSLNWQQEFVYDRFGNRSISGSGTTQLVGINRTQASVVPNTLTNRMYAPGETEANHPLIDYDSAGNQTKDHYTESVDQIAYDRIYDADNRMIRSTKTFSNATTQVSNYGYDGDGHRVSRTINGVETWQVYGVGGELLAEYGHDASPASPQKEYGYRNGQLLITAESGTTSALGPTGLTATPPASGASISLSWNVVSGATNYRLERATSKDGPYAFAGHSSSTTLIDPGVSSGTAYLYKVCAANNQDICTSGFSNIALGVSVVFTDADIKGFADDPSGQTVTTIKAAHITELRTTVNAVRHLAGMGDGVWTYNPLASQINVEDVKDLRTNLDAALGQLGIPAPPYQTDPTLIGFHENPNATPIRAAHIRELRTRATSGQGGSGGSGSSLQLHWMVVDQLGTPRMIFDQSGSLATMSRHDYLPFGEELTDNIGIRSGLGYTNGDGARQKFTSKERDSETGLDYSVHRYYSSTQGRFSSVDPTLQSINGLNPQSLNRYSYVLNDPLNFIDPFGLWELSYTEIWEGGKYVRTHVTITKTKEKDDANSLVKQLGYDPKSKEGQQLLNEIGAQLKQGEEVDPTKLGGIVGREYSTYEEKYSNQVQYNLAHPYKPGTEVSGPRDPDYADCSMTACRIAFPNQMRGYGLMGQPFDVGKASDMLAQTPSPKGGLRTGDVIRYGREDKTHFVNVLFTDDNGTTQAFSRTGVKGPFESLRVNDPNITQSYGKITGQYRPPFK